MANIYNDDYCDLPDGSDETLTSACSYFPVKFVCTADKKQIPTSRVNDGTYLSFVVNLPLLTCYMKAYVTVVMEVMSGIMLTYHARHHV